MWGYAYPPHALLPLILRKILFSPCKIILVAPLWPASRWFVQLLLLLVDCPLTLPLLPDLLTQDGILHRDPSVLKIHAWRLSGRPSRCEAFRSQWPNARHGPNGILLLPSTSRKWRRFVDWCSGRKIDPFSTSSAVIGDFLLFLFQQKLAISTLEGYRMAIASTLRATSGVEVGRCDTLRSLLENLECERARSRRQAPDWDLSLVLRRLRLPPFEPLSTCSLQLLTWKTVFLFSLASGKRRGEIHALLLDSFAHTQDWSSISFSVSPTFLSKTALSDRGADLLLSITIPAI